MTPADDTATPRVPPGGAPSGSAAPDGAAPAPVPYPLPRGSHSLDREIVLLSQRARMMEAVVHLAATKGYAAIRVQDITSSARVSRTTFYEQFSDKEECFLAAYDAGAHAHLEHVTAAIRRADTPLGQLRAATTAYVEVLAGEPEYAWAFLVEIHRVAEPALEARARVLGRYADLLAEWYEANREELGLRADVSNEVLRACVAATDSLIAERIRAGDHARLMETVPAMLYIQLALLGAWSEAAAIF